MNDVCVCVRRRIIIQSIVLTKERRFFSSPLSLALFCPTTEMSAVLREQEEKKHEKSISGNEKSIEKKQRERKERIKTGVGKNLHGRRIELRIANVISGCFGTRDWKYK